MFFLNFSKLNSGATNDERWRKTGRRRGRRRSCGRKWYGCSGPCRRFSASFGGRTSRNTGRHCETAGECWRHGWGSSAGSTGGGSGKYWGSGDGRSVNATWRGGECWIVVWWDEKVVERKRTRRAEEGSQSETGRGVRKWGQFILVCLLIIQVNSWLVYWSFIGLGRIFVIFSTWSTGCGPYFEINLRPPYPLTHFRDLAEKTFSGETNHPTVMHLWNIDRSLSVSITLCMKFRNPPILRCASEPFSKYARLLMNFRQSFLVRFKTFWQRWFWWLFGLLPNKNAHSEAGSGWLCCIFPLCWVTLAPPRKNRSCGTNPINQSSQSHYKGSPWKFTLDWLLLHISGKIVLRV